MRLLRLAVWVVLLAILVLAIYAKTSKAFATGVTLSIVGGDGSCNGEADVLCVISNAFFSYG